MSRSGVERDRKRERESVYGSVTEKVDLGLGFRVRGDGERYRKGYIKRGAIGTEGGRIYNMYFSVHFLD